MDLEKTKLMTVEELEMLAQKLSSEATMVNIVNAGLMNAGKSSLFNSLVNQKNLFEVQDVPTTIVCKTFELFEGVHIIDSPGIEARESDTDEAYRAYNSADMILFVHNSSIGELHASELEAINAIKQTFPHVDDFWKRFCLVLSRADAKEATEIEKIKNKMKKDIEKNCKGKEYPLFVTSSVRYWKGIEQNQPVFIEQSGIVNLKNFIQKYSLELKSEAIQFRSKRLEDARSKSIQERMELKRRTAEIVQQKRISHAKRVEKVQADLSQIQNAAKCLWDNCRDLANEVRQLS